MTEQLQHLKLRQRLLDMQVDSDKVLSAKIASEVSVTILSVCVCEKMH